MQDDLIMSSHSTVSIDGTGVIGSVYVLHWSLVDALLGGLADGNRL